MSEFKTYEEFVQNEDLKILKKKHELQIKANIAYNKGLLNGLGLKGAWLYPLLKRSTT